ncbi:MAG: DNA methyltransferase [Thermofilum sp.]
MRREVSFRKEVDLPSTTYATHGLYFYPAKFIPHVVRYALVNYTKEGDVVFDPFCGHGTVAIESSLLGRNVICWDLNPLAEIIARSATFEGELSLEDFKLDWKYDQNFKPRYSNIHYWYPPAFFETLSRLWGFWHNELFLKARTEAEISKAYVVAIPLFKISKLFSFADEKIPKLYRSKRAIEKVQKLLEGDWEEKMRKAYWKFAKECHKKLCEYQSLSPKSSSVVLKTSRKAGENLVVFDATKTAVSTKVDLLLTSPPYLQSQEYIRTFKLELAWLGYDDFDIRALTKCEIPYNSPEEVPILSETYKHFHLKVCSLENPKLLQIYEKYFQSLASFFSRNAPFLKKVAIFVGPAKIRNIRIPIDTILKEHLEKIGFRHVETLIDKIVARRLFKTEKNPATNLADERTPTEHLLVMVNEGAEGA